ncbi:hypothetical protein EDM00_08320 [Ornithobacterium rhinotracheale]|uniref:hypothetical protein n=1 Tax=Ornithobacterium rhinotracheale TaxID=28251 RepID=UPI00129C58D0|nr:hypothetical protein [Ornithobacterium rhinotracheale]MRI63990.1 hypothetical protein [Ornithobacterium rhinotracheale]
MKTININNKEIRLFEGGEDGFIGVEYNSSDFDLESPFYRNNGLKKRVQVTSINIDVENMVIHTEKITSSITPTGDLVDIRVNPVFETSPEDTKLFWESMKKVIIAALFNGIVRDMKVSRAAMTLEGELIEKQPVPIPEVEEDEDDH